MTVYFMPYFKKISLLVIIFFIFFLIINKFSYSEENKILIKDVEIKSVKNFNYISFNQEIILNYPIKEAIDKGIPLVFKVTLKVVELRNIWPNKSVKTEVRYYQIEYKALRKTYETIDVNGQKYENKIMENAIKKLLKVENMEFTFDDKNKNYELWLTVMLERKKLPKPLQVNYFDRTWYMSSQKSIHKIGKIQ